MTTRIVADGGLVSSIPEVRYPVTKHAISMQQIGRWLGGATTSPNEASKKAKLKMLMIRG